MKEINVTNHNIRGNKKNRLIFDNQIDEVWLNSKSAAAYLDISPNALRIMVCRGQVKASKLNGRLRFRVVDLVGLLKEVSHEY